MSSLEQGGGSKPLWISVLGPVRVWRGSTALNLGGPQQRMTLVALLLSENSPVPVDDLIDALWTNDPPRAAVQVIRTYIYRLRRELETGEPLITALSSGYAINATVENFDLAAFREETARAETARQAGDFEAVSKHLDSGLALWSEPLLGGVSGAYIDRQRAGLERLRLTASEAQLTNKIELGSYDEAAAQLADLVARHPLDERFRELLMSAFHRSGRPAEALAVFDEAEQLLGEELALDPGPGLQALRERIVRDDSAPAQLPADLPRFVGRTTELGRATALLPAAGAPPATVVVVGTAGIGKTSLAVHWAHQIAPDYPDGQLYLNLRGFDSSGRVMEPSEAIRVLLLGLDVPAGEIPADLDAQAAYYRSRLANRRVLILLDNARDAEQVRPLLPGTPGSLVIVTSRSGLSSLVARDGARPLPLDLLSREEAYDFMARQLTSDRLAAEPVAVQQILEASAGLPLALGIVSARAAGDPALTLTAIATELRDGRGGLDAFTMEGLDGFDSRAVFSWSYDALSINGARLFRLLTLHPTGDVAAGAAASLLGLDLRETRLVLAELTRAYLLTERTPGRFRCHDLLRAYAEELSAAIDPMADQQAAFRRLVDHYLHASHAANLLLYPRETKLSLEAAVEGTAIVEFRDDEAAMRWLAAEYRSVVALVAAAHAASLPTQTWQLAWSISDYLQRRGHWYEQVAVQRAALSSATRLGDLVGQAHALRGLGSATGRLGDLSAAVGYLEQACRLFGGAGELGNEARSHRALAFIRGAQGEFGRALSESESGLSLYRAVGDLPGQAGALNDVGWCLAQLGRYPEALESCLQARALFEQLDLGDGQAATLDSLGYIYQQLGDLAQASNCYREAIRRFRAAEDKHEESNVLMRLAGVQEETGDLEGARASWQSALAVLEPLGRPDAEVARAHLAALAD